MPPRKPVKNNNTRNFLIGFALLVIGVFGVMYWMYNNTMYAAKNWGGTYTLSTPEDGIHIGTTWKADTVWTETYYPKDNKCVFKQEDSGFKILDEGKVVIQPCNYKGAK